MLDQKKEDIIQIIRIECLNRFKNKEISQDDYNKIIFYLYSPHDNVKKFDVSKINLDNLAFIENEDLINFCLYTLFKFNKENKKDYSKKFKGGQYIVWRSVFECAENLISIKENLKSLNYEIREADYLGSCHIIKEHLDYLAAAFREMTIFEKKMGVDRYLATTGLKRDINILHDILSEIREICNAKLEGYVTIFRRKWNLTAISKTVEKSFGLELDENDVTYSSSKDKRNVIFLLFDGFGYTQYLWFLAGLKKRKSLTYGINLFDWLQNFDEFNDELILSSNLVTDTASCLATIFSGQLPSKTGIVASKVMNGSRIANIKKLEGMDLLNFTRDYPNSFLDDLNGVETLVLNGSGRFMKNDTATFTGSLYGDSNIIFINPADRIFKVLADKIDPESEKQFISVYFPLIDRTGHSIGSFTSFESYEYEKINILLVDFLLDLAYNKQELFDAKTKIIISADHGMFETSYNYVTMREILNEFKNNYKRPPKIAINNRSIILYHINPRDLEDFKYIIGNILDKKGITHKIYSDEDDSVNEMFPKFLKDEYQNTLIILFDADGIAVQQDIERQLLHYGGHGGCSCEEVFVPLITLELTPNLHETLIDHFSKLK